MPREGTEPGYGTVVGRNKSLIDMQFIGCALFVIVIAFGSAFAEPHPSAWTHENAIELARNGKFVDAKRILSALRDSTPDDRQLLYDETVIFAWANDNQQALQNAQLIDPEVAPDYVVIAVAKAARNAGVYAQAIIWYAALLDRDAANLDARVGLAMSHADGGRADAAAEVLAAAPEQQRKSLPLALAEAYVYATQGRFMDALASYQRALDAEPENRAALRGTALMLRMALLPGQALALAAEHPGIISDDENAHLEADLAALQVRYGAQTAYPVPRRYEGTDQALSEIDMLLARSDLDPAVRLRLRYDRIIALADRLRMGEAIKEFEALAADPRDLPAYVLVGAGRAYLYERKPEQARGVLEIAVAREPGNIDSSFPLFFAYADLQEHKLALNLAESLLETLPPVNQVPDSPVRKGSSAYLRAAIMAGLARTFADQLADSQQYFEQLLAQAPHNTDLRQELANVYRSRGWLDRSVAEYAQVLAVEPELLSARVGYAHTSLDSRDYLPVEQQIRALSEQLGDELAVKNLAERWQVYNRSELDVDAEYGESSGATFGEDQYRVDAIWLSRPIAHRYRALIQSHDAFAGFPEGEARRRRLGAGVEYRYKRWLARVRLSGNRGGGGLGLRGYVDYRFSDHWTFGGNLETESNATPLRGERAGISSDLLSVTAGYAKHESTSLSTTLSYQDFSDGNAAKSIFAGAQQRLVTKPSYKLTLLGELYVANRDRDDVPYFSPRHDFTWGIGFRNDWQMLRRYDFALSHRLTGTAGRYEQSAFAGAGIWALDYEFQADLNKHWSARFGVSRRSNVYDGAREYSTFFLAGISGRF